jgi:hypothetical protein
VNKPLFMRHLSVFPVPNLGKTTRSPQSDLTPWILTLPFGLSQDSLAVELVASRTFRCLGSSGGSEIQEKTLKTYLIETILASK